MIFLNYFHQYTLTSLIIKRTIKENYKIRSEPFHLYFIIINPKNAIFASQNNFISLFMGIQLKQSKLL